MAFFPTILNTVGATPLVRLNRLTKGLDAEILLKGEFKNPLGSVKDRIGKAMIEVAEASGALKPGGNDDLPQNSLKARAPRNSLIIKAEVILHNHFPPTRPEKRFSPQISQHRTRATGLQ